MTSLPTQQVHSGAYTYLIDTASPRWLLSFLIKALHPHLACSCKQRSTGTMFYRNGGDLLLGISKLLKMNRNTKLSGSNDNPTPTYDDSQLVSVCSAMNYQIHQQIKTPIAKDADAPSDIASLDIPQFLQPLDPQIWKMIVLLTQSVRDRHSNVNIQNLPATHTKKMWCFFLLCVLQFCTDHR